MGHECNLLYRNLLLEADLFYMENINGQRALSKHTKIHVFSTWWSALL